MLNKEIKIKFLKAAKVVNVMNLRKFQENNFAFWNWNIKFFPFFVSSATESKYWYWKAFLKDFANFIRKNLYWSRFLSSCWSRPWKKKEKKENTGIAVSCFSMNFKKFSEQLFFLQNNWEQPYLDINRCYWKPIF